MNCINRVILFFSLCVFLAALTGCAANGDNYAGQDKEVFGVIYQPQARSAITSTEVARKNLEALLSGDNGRVPGVKVSGIPGWNDNWRDAFIKARDGATSSPGVHYNKADQPIYVMYKNINVFDDRIQASERIALNFADIVESTIAVEHWRHEEVKSEKYSHMPEWGRPHKDSDLRPYVISLPLSDLWFFFETLNDATAFADNLFFIQQQLIKEGGLQFNRFEALAAQYRTTKVKPEVSEEQRKFIVQANAMTQKKDYEKAVKFYLKAIDVDPVSYPGAYFNIALLAAQLENYPRAIFNMKKYLLLVPAAQDARSAQDKIYEWEALSQ